MRQRERATNCNEFPHSVEFLSTVDIELMEALWAELEPRSDISFFQSWGWVGCWLKVLPRDRRTLLVIIRDHTGKLVGVAILGNTRNFRHRLFLSRGYYLHETGERCYDCLTIEYNGLVVEKGRLVEAAEAFLTSLAARSNQWDELFLSGVDATQCSAFEAAARPHLLTHRLLYEKPSYFVDLDAVRIRSCYLDAISGNTRYQIKRAMKIYEIGGPVVLENARSVEEALNFLDALKGLHQAYWNGRGQPGSFANPFFEDFHRHLIKQRFSAGEIQLLKISTRDRIIGYLYNLVYRGIVYAYQSGFSYGTDNKLKPGLVSHYLAIDHNVKSGARIYDFMAGEGQHKLALSTQMRSLFWIVEQRNRLRFRLEDWLRRQKQRSN